MLANGEAEELYEEGRTALQGLCETKNSGNRWNPRKLYAQVGSTIIIWEPNDDNNIFGGGVEICLNEANVY